MGCSHCAASAPPAIVEHLTTAFEYFALLVSDTYAAFVVRVSASGETRLIGPIAPASNVNRIGFRFPYLGMGCSDGTILIYDVRTGGIENVVQACAAESIWMVCWSDRYLATLHDFAKVLVHAHVEGRVERHVVNLVRPETGHDVHVYFMDMREDMLACCHRCGCLTIHHIVSGEPIVVQKCHTDVVFRVQFANNYLVSASRDSTAKIWQLEGNHLVLMYTFTLGAPVHGLAVCGYYAAVMTEKSANLYLIDIRTGAIVASKFWTPGDGRFNVSVQFDGETIVSVSAEQRILKLSVLS
eukprot:m.116763 g.116763  ORF g.116763 m.116763 type:complete len:298 (-) comp51956_c1_seq2:278-1171(-)